MQLNGKLLIILNTKGKPDVVVALYIYHVAFIIASVSLS